MSSKTIPQPGEPIIEVRDLKKIFGTQTVLDGVTMDIHRGETLVVMGGSGCGKSTFLRMLIGSFPPSEGTISMLGNRIDQLDEEGMNEIRSSFGILFQSGALFQSMTLAENVALPLEEHTDLDRTIIDIQVKIKLELVGLREHADKLPSQISGGMKKRAGLARALALDPLILFYDEPSAGLDPVTSAEIDQLIVDLTKKLGVTSVVVTHEMDSAFTIADRMVMLDKGRVLRIDTREAFDEIRKIPADAVEKLTFDEQLIRQFLRGDPVGPITQRRAETNYADDLLSTAGPSITRSPAVEATRRRSK
jgi:phospholipid/cholesterol/gamma-HCH transport system ATP-binding protein